MNIVNNIVNVLDSLLNERVKEDLRKIRVGVLTWKENAAAVLKEKMDGAGSRFVSIMMKLSIIKLAIAMITLIVMAVLFFLHLHVFDPITQQFSKWVSTPLSGFIVLIITVKFVGISIGLTLTIMSVKNITFESIRMRLIEYCRLRLGMFFRRKESLQRV